MLRLAAVLLTITAVMGYGDEKLLKPVAGPGAGVAVDGLRSTVSMVKNDFGPGESIMAVWKVSNESNAAVEVGIDHRAWSGIGFSVRRDGKDLQSPRTIAEGKKKQFTLEPGASHSEFIDLTSLEWTDKTLFRPFGNYELSIRLDDKNLLSGWTKFRIMPPGEQRPQASPELAEKLRSLIANLGNNEFAVREQAYQQILTIGKPALGMLEDAIAMGGDAEIAVRCRRLINEIRHVGIAPPPLPAPPIAPVPPVPPRPILPPAPPIQPVRPPAPPPIQPIRPVQPDLEF